MLFKNCKIVDAKGESYADIRVEEGIFKEIGKNLAPVQNEEVIDVANRLVMPSFIDMNVRVLDEQLSSKNLNKLIESAIKGGVGELTLMPDSSPQIKSEATIEFVNTAALGKIGMNPSILAIKNDFSITDISILSKLGCSTIYLQSHKAGILLRRIFEYANMWNSLIVCDCNDTSLSENGVMNEGYLSSKLGLPGISSIYETKEVSKIIEFTYSISSRVLFNALSSPRSLEIIARAKKEDGLKVYSEVSIHHLILSEDACEDYNTSAKVMPPLQSESTKKSLIDALKNGKIDVLTSLHSPKSISRKDMAFEEADYGIAGIELLFPLCYSFLHKKEGISLSQLSALLTRNAAQIMKKTETGLIKKGYGADFVIIDENKKFVVNDKSSPYHGYELSGTVDTHYKGGRRL